MTPLVPITLFGWPVLIVVLFSLLPPLRAVLIAVLGAWMFLPIAGYPIPGLPDVTKMSVTCIGVFVGAAIYDAGRLSSLRFLPADIPMLLWLILPFPSAIAGGYGPYEGLSSVMNQLVAWGMPYLIGRMYFNNPRGLFELAVAIFSAGLIYIPLVLFEARMSPQLHTWVYGFHQHSFAQTKRSGGWRPTVFMQHGLEVAMFMGTSAVCGVWLWYAGKFRSLRRMPVWALAATLFGVAAVCKSTYALLLMLSGTAVLFVSRFLNTRLLLAGLLCVAPAYAAARTVGGWRAQELRDISAMVWGEDKEGSLEVRLTSEDTCWQFMKSRSIFGDGRLEHLFLRDPDGALFIPDGYWLIVLTRHGVVGLLVLFSFLLGPSALLLTRHTPRDLFGARLAGATVMATVLTLYAMDNLLNAMLNPIYLLGLGGLAGASAKTSGFHGRSGVPAVPRVPSARQGNTR